MNRIFLLLSALLSFNALAQTTNFIEIGAQQLKFDGVRDSDSGFAITGNKDFGSFYLEAHYSSIDISEEETMIDTGDSYNNRVSIFTDTSVNQREFTIGTLFLQTDSSLFDLSFSHTRFTVKNTSTVDAIITEFGETETYREVSTGEGGVDLYALEVNYEKTYGHSLTTEIGIGAEHVNNDDTNFVWNAGLSYPLTSKFIGKLHYRDAKDYTELTASLVYAF